MSKSVKAVITIIVIVLIVWLVAHFMAKPAAAPVSQNPSGDSVTASSSVDSDLSSIDAQMNGLDQDNANASQSVQTSQNQ
jgi:hypothetical protein